MTTSRVLIVLLGVGLAAWTLLDVRRATSTRARLRAVSPTAVGILGGLLVFLALDQ